MPGNPLHAEVTADSADYVSGVEMAVQSSERLSDQARDTAAAMHILQGRTEKAGNEAMQAGAKAGASSAGFSALAGSAGSTTGSFSALSAVTTGTLIPSLLALSTVMAPLLAAMGGFVTIAGSIAAVGLGGFLGAVATNGEQLKSTFKELTSTLRSEFAPVFDVFAGVLERLMESFTDIIPELVPAQDVIRQIAGQFESLGKAIIGVLPAFTEMAVQLTNQFLPAFVEWTEGVLPKIPGMLQGLIPVMLEVGSTLQPMARSIAEIAPTMTEFGMTVLNIVTPALTRAISVFDGAMEAVNSLDKRTAGLVAGLTIALPIIAKVGLALASLSNPALGAALAIGALGAAFATNFGGIRDTVMGALESIQEFVASLEFGQIIESEGLVGNFQGAIGQLESLGQTIVTGVQPAIRTVAQTFRDNRPQIRSFFEQIAENVDMVVTAFRKGVLPVIRFVLENYTIPLINRLAGVFSRNFGDILSEVTQTMNVMQNRLQTFVGWMMPLWNMWGDEIQTVAKFAFDAIITSLELVLTTLSTVIQGSLNLIQGDWAGVWRNAKDLFLDPFNIMLDFLGRWGIADAITSAISGAETAMSNAVNGLVQTGKDTLKNLGTWLRNKWNIAADLASAFTGAGKALASEFRSAFNEAIPKSVGTKPVDVPGTDKTVGGVSIDLPQLDTGGYIEEDGVAQLHAGERVVQAAEVDRDGGGKGASDEVLEKVASKLDEPQRLDGTVQIEINQRQFRNLFEAEFQKLGREASQ